MKKMMITKTNILTVIDLIQPKLCTRFMSGKHYSLSTPLQRLREEEEEEKEEMQRRKAEDEFIVNEV